MEEYLKPKIVSWLKTKSVSDIVYAKKNPDATLFGKHIGLTSYDIEKLLDEPEEKIKAVERTISHPNERLLIVRRYSKSYDTTYIILDPFSQDLDEKFKGKVAIVTAYPTKIKP
ncbi:hypothetical protein HZB02_00815 [Candidatus Woesearchaeota archaeon]|nr:hypothetical protein [Candidatus Woesearchaeota archaeon]